MAAGRPRVPLRQRFERMVIRREEGCWGWKGAPDKDGYGRIWSGGTGGQHMRAHRVSFELFRGKIPEGLEVLHRCDNPPCTRPDHLFLGTNLDNSIDMVRKNRQAKGESHGQHLHPERTARGDRQGLRVHPERRPFGVRNGRYSMPERTARGERNGTARLTTEQVIEIRRQRARGLRLIDIAKTFGIAPAYVSEIARREAWAHIA